MKKTTFKIRILISILFLSTSLFISCSDDDTVAETDDNTATTDDDTTDDDGNDGNETTESNFTMIVTGQTSSYDNDGNVLEGLTEGDAFYGQDADYLKGEPFSFTDNGDGTVTDNNTGLMWEQIPNTAQLGYDDSVAYCEDLVLAEYDDWRIPNIKELFSITNYDSGWPYIDQTYLPLADPESSTVEDQFWSSTQYVGVLAGGISDVSDAVFGMNHSSGHIKAYTTGTSGQGDDNADTEKYVRAVRGTEYGISDYTDNGDGTITDEATGLMWSQADDGEGMNWEDALAYAESSELAGYTDWRLPNIKELQSIADYSYSITATDPALVGPALDPLFSATLWENENGLDDYGYAWSSTSGKESPMDVRAYGWYLAIGRSVDMNGDDSHGAGAVRFDTKVEGGPDGEEAGRVYNYVRLVRDIN